MRMRKKEIKNLRDLSVKKALHSLAPLLLQTKIR
jgi:hypothetical protein